MLHLGSENALDEERKQEDLTETSLRERRQAKTAGIMDGLKIHILYDTMHFNRDTIVRGVPA